VGEVKLGQFKVSGSYIGDCCDLMRQIPDESIHCVVTSPPYWGLRDYGVDGQFGLEKTPDDFVTKTVEVFREVWRVLRDDGTLWLNLGDSYCASGGDTRVGFNARYHGQNPETPTKQNSHKKIKGLVSGLRAKNLVGMPWRVAFALQADGWILRSDIVWHKPNPMPESVTDRPTKSHEYIFLMTKSPKYYYDAEAIKERANLSSQRSKPVNAKESVGNTGSSKRTDFEKIRHAVTERNKRSVWTVPAAPYSGAHFATYPPKLIEPCILAGTSPTVCGVCATPWVRQVETSYDNPGNRTTNGPRSVERRHETAGFETRLEKRTKTIGWHSQCEHDDGSG